MKNPKLAIQILNLINGLLLITYLAKTMEWLPILRPVTVIHIIIAAFIVFGLKSWLEVKYEMTDPIKTNKITNSVFMIGAGVFLMGITFKFMHWPFGSLLLFLGVVTVIISYFLSFILDEDDNDSNSEIIDDL